MPPEPFDPSVNSDLLVAQGGSANVLEIEGRNVIRLSLEPWMQGHTFAVDMSPHALEEDPTGPFKIEYVLGTEFILHENELSSLQLEQGYSHIKVSQEFDHLTVSLSYSDTTCPDVRKDAVLRFGIVNSSLQKLIIETPEVELDKAIQHTGQIVADILDAISFLKRLPLTIRNIDVHAVENKFSRQYRTFSYSSRQLAPEDLTQAVTIPARLKPALRLFREGISSARPPYRLLCLYRVREIIQHVRRENDEKVLANDMKPNRPARVLQSNTLTNRYFSNLVGKRVGNFLDHVRTEYRLAVAHGVLDEISRLVLDPANIRIDHRIDFTNAALEPVIAEMIEDEIAFMARHGLDKPEVSGQEPTNRT